MTTSPAAAVTSGRGTSEHPPLRIGLMLRAIDDVDGQGIYIRKLCNALFEVDTRNEYVAFYCRPEQSGRYLCESPSVTASLWSWL